MLLRSSDLPSTGSTRSFCATSLEVRDTISQVQNQANLGLWIEISIDFVWNQVQSQFNQKASFAVVLNPL